jgi:hypothetical protein
MKYKFQGKRAEVGVYDDAWIHCDDAVEFIVPPPRIMYDKLTAERQLEWQIMIEEFLKEHPLGESIDILGKKMNNTKLMGDYYATNGTNWSQTGKIKL